MATNSLPLSTDVVVNITVPIAATATNMSVGCILTQDAAPTSWGVGQILAFYADFPSFSADFGVGTSIYAAGEAFFGQSPRPSQLAVGLVTGAVLETSLAVGGFEFTANPTAGDHITIGTQVYTFQSTLGTVGDVMLDATTLATTLGHLVATINGTGTAGTDFYVGTPSLSTLVTAAGTSPNVSITAIPMGYSGVLALSSAEANAVATLMAVPANPSITTYAAAVQTVATAGGSYLFGWAMANTLRTVAVQQAMANWCQANGYSCWLTSNDTTNDENAMVATDIGSVLKLSNNKATCGYCHDFSSEYPEISSMALMLSTDYSGVNTTMTLKFKALAGVSASSLTETQYNVLNSKNYNMVSLTGNQVVITREGKNFAPAWWTDQYCGIQNFANEIQNAVFNVFLAKKKVPYTLDGQLMLKQPCTAICQRYVNNGFLAARLSTDSEGADIVLPAFTVTPGDLSLATASQRASRVGPPISITAYLAGAIHAVTLNINMNP